jgi:hypothetical protein
MSLIAGEAPLSFIPSLSAPQHIPFLTAADIEIVRREDLRIETRLAASSLFQAYSNSRMRDWVRRELGLGWTLDPQLRLLQLPPAFVLSRGDFDRGRLQAEQEFLADALAGVDVFGMDIGAEAAMQVATNFLDAASDAWATALIAPSLAHLDSSPRVLRNNLTLLEASIAYFEREGLDSVADDRGPFAKQRHLFATIQIEAKLLRDSKWLKFLQDAYSSYSSYIDGYWVQALNLTASASPATLRGLTDFVYPLQDETQVPVTLDRVGAFGYGFAANGIAALCMGTGAPEYVTHPPTRFKPMRKPGATTSFAFVVWDQVLLRNISHSGRHKVRGLRAYRRHPCAECGAHEASRPPRATAAKRRHGFYWHQAQVHDLCHGTLLQSQRRFLDAVRVARAESAELGYPVDYYDSLVATMRPEAIERVGGI